MSGLLHLLTVPKVKKLPGHVLTNMLQTTVRKFCDTSHGRMIPLEDQCHELLSWFPLVEDHVYLVRVANVDAMGKPFAEEHFYRGLINIVKTYTTVGSYEVMTPDVGELYEHYYHPSCLVDHDLLYVPDNRYCETIVVRSRFK